MKVHITPTPDKPSERFLAFIIQKRLIHWQTSLRIRESKLGSAFLSLLDWIFYSEKKVSVDVKWEDVHDISQNLSLIIIPYLELLKDPIIAVAPDVDDLPEYHHDSDIYTQWEWVVDEMIWAFEQHALKDKWMAQYATNGLADAKLKLAALTNQDIYISSIVDPDSEDYDQEGFNMHQDRMRNGRRLFAKYYEEFEN